MVIRAEPDKPQRPADSLNAAMPSDAGTSSFPEIPAPMLDIHAPHESIHTWKSFFVHLGTITIGLLIAIGLEQSVESLHRHRQVREMELKLHQESTDNLEVVAYDRKGCDTRLAAIAANVESLKLLGTQQSSASWSPVALPPTTFFIPDETVWLMMRDGGLLPLVPDLLAENYWKLDATESALVTIRTSLVYSGIRLNAAIDVYSNAGPLNSQDIGVLRAAYSDYAANLHTFRNSLDGYDLFIRRVLAGKSMDFRDVTEELGRARPH